MVGSKRVIGAVAAAAFVTIAMLAAPVAAAPTAWQFTKTPRTAHTDLVMTKVSCPAPRFCLSLEGSASQTQRWNGRRWAVLPTAPRPSTDFTCPTTTMCVAVSYWNNRPSADTWDG